MSAGLFGAALRSPAAIPGDPGLGETVPCDTEPGDTVPCDTEPGDTVPCDTEPGDTGPCDTDAGSSVRWVSGAVVVIDQRALPAERRVLRLATVDDVIEAIRTLAVRGAPAIGLAGAFGVALAAYRATAPDGTLDRDALRAEADRIAAARPTAVNLEWAVRRVCERAADGADAVLAEADALRAEDLAVGRAAVQRAASLVRGLIRHRPLRLYTHCNTGRLATAGAGTALGAVLELARAGEVAEVLVGETRPLLQGLRLTAWELSQAGVPYRVCVDSAAAAAMSLGMVDCVLVGADRIAANGDTANKIGTYGLAVAAARHGIPFIVVAPESTWDDGLADGTGIVIEERAATEVTGYAGGAVGPRGAGAFNPAFDVTPGELITAVVSERRVLRPARAALAERPAGRTSRPGPGLRATDGSAA